MQTPKRLPYLVVALFSILYFAPFLRILSQNGDEGTLIDGAVRVAEGQVPFRDFFEVMGPGTFYWLALFFKLLGTTWFASRICLLVTTVAITVVLYYLARRLHPGLGAVPVIFFVAVSFHSWNAISHHMDSTLFGLLAFLAFVYWMDRANPGEDCANPGEVRRPYALFLAGIAAGLTSWIMLPKGVLLCLSFVVLLWTLYRKKPIFWTSLRVLLGGYLLVMTIVVTMFWLAGGLADMIHANLIWPLTNYGGANGVPYGLEFQQMYWTAFTMSLSKVVSPVTSNAISGFLSVPFIVVMGLPLVLLALCVRYRRSAFDRATLPYWVAGCAFWLSEIHRKDLVHIVFGSPLFILLAFYYCRRLRSRAVSYALQLVAICAVALAMLNPLVALAAHHKMLTRRGTLYQFEGDPVLAFLNARVRPGEAVFVYPYAPMYYFLSAAKNPTRYSFLMYCYDTDAQFREVVRSLEDNQVRYVVWDRAFPERVTTWFPTYHISPDKMIVEPYLTEHYNVIGGAGHGWQFLERKESMAASRRP